MWLNLTGNSSTRSDTGEIQGHTDGFIQQNRKCRDPVFIFLFLCCCVALIANSIVAFVQGDPSRLMHGLDYKGNICGDKHSNPDLRELEVRYLLNPIQVQKHGEKIGHSRLDDVRAICLMECPTPSEDSLAWVCDYPEGDIQMTVDDWIDLSYDYYEFLTPAMRNSSLHFQGPCYPVFFRSINVYWNCQVIGDASNVSLWYWQQMGGLDTDAGLDISEIIHHDINSHSAVLKRYATDAAKAWPVLLICGVLLPFLLSVMWFLIAQYFILVAVWITIALFDVLVVCATLLFYRKAGWIGDDSLSVVIGENRSSSHIHSREINHLHFVAVVMTCVMVLAIFMSLAITRRILLAVPPLKVAMKFVKDVQPVAFVILPYLAISVFYIFWFSSMLYIFSSGKIHQNSCNRGSCCVFDLKMSKIDCNNCCGYTLHFGSHITVAVLFHIFGFYWVTQFTFACTSVFIASAVSSYYRTAGRSVPKDCFTITSSTKVLFPYSLGSVALGSLILPIVGSARCILGCIRRLLKLINSASAVNIKKHLLHAPPCCISCSDWLVRALNHNAYIVIAVSGEGFFRATWMAADMITCNISLIKHLTVIGDVVIFLGKLCISLCCAVFAFLLLDDHKYKSSHDRISSPLVPVLVCSLFGYFTATLFFTMAEMSIDTFIFSFCRDTMEHSGIAKYAPPLLIENLS